jgi:surface polysaccharide O-acyltransferase-like enzyme
MDGLLSLKMRRLSFFCTMTVVWVHAFNLDDRYLWPGYKIYSGFDWNSFIQLWFGNSLFRFAIPLFFLISGYLMAEREGRLTYPKMVGKRAKSLLVPYLAWSFVGLVLTFWWESDPFLNQFVESAHLRAMNNKPLHSLNFSDWLFTWILDPVSFQLWFLRTVFLYAVLYPFLVRVIDRYPTWYFSFMVVNWLISSGFFIIEAEGLLFFSIGIFIRKKEFPVSRYPLPIPFYGLVMLVAFLSLGKTGLAFLPGDWTFPLAYLIHKIHQPLLLLVFWFGYDRLPVWKPGSWFDKLSATNFFIYGAHVPLVYYVTDWFFAEFGKDPVLRLGLFVLLPLTTILLSGLVALFLKRYIPALFKVFSGWRTYPEFSESKPQ